MSGAIIGDVRQTLFLTAQARVTALQSRVLKDDPGAIRTLALLRRCDPGEVGTEPQVWEVTLGDLPDALTHRNDRLTDQATPAELSLHAILVLYALHQQSRDEGVHRPGVRFGQAVGTLARARAFDEELDRSTVARLHHAALATTFGGQVQHIRGLIQLMRAEQPTIGLDYARLAVDLWQVADPRRDSRQVLARWGRDLHQRPQKLETSDSTKEETQ